MIKLDDYLYDGHTVLRILHEFSDDMKKAAEKNDNIMDLNHSNFLIQYTELLEHNEFLTSESQRILNFYKYLTKEYPYLAFTFRGRIKSLIRTEEKYNGYIVSFIDDFYTKNKAFPALPDIKNCLNRFRDLIAYRFVVSFPECHLKEGEKREDVEVKYLYEIANILPKFMEKFGFTAETSSMRQDLSDSPLSDEVKPYYRDYILHPKASGYRSLHITFFDNISRNYMEMQLRTKDMDDYAEIGMANHSNYEKIQKKNRTRRSSIPVGEFPIFDDAIDRVSSLQNLDLSKVNVNMFAAVNNSLMNDNCGLYRGRLILPYEHLSHFQNDQIG